MKTFTIYPDKARALGNVMNNNSNVEDMVGVNANVIALVDDENPLTDDEGNEYVLPITVDYDNLPFPIFEMGVLESLYATSLTLNLSRNNCYVNDTITVTATLRDNNNDLLDGRIAFFCGNDCITNGNNTGNNVAYANTANGVVSFNYSFSSMGSYTISAYSLATNMHHRADDTRSINVSKKTISINIDGINTNSIYYEDIPFYVHLYSNNQRVAGLEYSILLDGELFDTGISPSEFSGEVSDDPSSSYVDERFTLSNLEPGTHTIQVSYSGNNLYESASETIQFYKDTPLEIFFTWSNPTLVVEVYHGTDPVVGMPATIYFSGPMNGNWVGQETDSLGKITLSLGGFLSGNYTVTVTTENYGGFAQTSKTTSITK